MNPHMKKSNATFWPLQVYQTSPKDILTFQVRFELQACWSVQSTTLQTLLSQVDVPLHQLRIWCWTKCHNIVFWHLAVEFSSFFCHLKELPPFTEQEFNVLIDLIVEPSLSKQPPSCRFAVKSSKLTPWWIPASSPKTSDTLMYESSEGPVRN